VFYTITVLQVPVSRKTGNRAYISGFRDQSIVTLAELLLSGSHRELSSLHYSFFFFFLPSDRRFSAKWLPTFADKGCHVVSVTDPYGRILGFQDRRRNFYIK
jgi:hypothetical protein